MRRSIKEAVGDTVHALIKTSFTKKELKEFGKKNSEVGIEKLVRRGGSVEKVKGF